MIAELSQNREKSAQALSEAQQIRLTRLVCRILFISFALLETWSQRRFINEDGVSYLDMSDALLRHNWHLLVNPIWSPLYPLLIGIGTWVTRPSGSWEVPFVHILNFFIFLAALASFEFLLRQVTSVFRLVNDRSGNDTPAFLPAWTWELAGYSLFAWSTFGMIWGPRMLTPDLSVAAFVYLDCALVLRLKAGAPRLQTCLLLGLALGVGYYAKAILFPMAFLFLAIAFLVTGSRKKALFPIAAAFVVFCAVSAPLFLAMSSRVGKLSYSEVGNLNYAWHVNYVGAGKEAGGPFYPAQSGAPAYLKRPVTLLYSHPEVYEFREPYALTYPPRSDMQYWGLGTPVVFSLHNQFLGTIAGLRLFVRDPHIVPLTALIFAGVILAVFRPSSLGWRSILPSWPLLIPGVIGPCLYLVISVEPRYVAPFFVVVLLGLFPSLLPGGSAAREDRAMIGPMALSACLITFSAALVIYHLAGFPRDEGGDIFLQVGTALNSAGVSPGEDVAIIGDSSDGCRWARMARVRIVSQILREDVADYWHIKDPRMKADIYDAFTKAGASAVIAEQTPALANPSEWHRLGETDYYVHLLSPAESH